MDPTEKRQTPNLSPFQRMLMSTTPRPVSHSATCRARTRVAQWPTTGAAVLAWRRSDCTAPSLSSTRPSSLSFGVSTRQQALNGLYSCLLRAAWWVPATACRRCASWPLMSVVCSGHATDTSLPQNPSCMQGQLACFARDRAPLSKTATVWKPTSASCQSGRRSACGLDCLFWKASPLIDLFFSVEFSGIKYSHTVVSHHHFWTQKLGTCSRPVNHLCLPAPGHRHSTS